MDLQRKLVNHILLRSGSCYEISVRLHGTFRFFYPHSPSLLQWADAVSHFCWGTFDVCTGHLEDSRFCWLPLKKVLTDPVGDVDEKQTVPLYGRVQCTGVLTALETI